MNKYRWRRVCAAALCTGLLLGTVGTAAGLEENFDAYTDIRQLQGAPFGSPTLSLTAGKDGQGLEVSSRTEAYFGYSVDLTPFAGKTISLSADVSADGNTLSATAKTSIPGQSDSYTQLASVTCGGEFAALTGEYAVPADCSSCVVYFETAQGVNYVIDNLSIQVVGEEETAASLKDLYAGEFRMGVACEAISHWNNRLSEIGNPAKEALILEQFNSITFGNELKPSYNMDYRSKEATETDLPFKHNRAAIEMLDWAKANDMPVRGHTLIWHSQCEDSVFCKNYEPHYKAGKLDPACLVDAETMKLRMESYIHHVMEYMYANGYGDVIYAWDVVNEAVEPGISKDGLRNSYWYQTIGPEFVYDAFRYAREAVEQYSAQYADLYGVDPSDPEALKTIQPKLFYNDYNEFQANKRDVILRVVAPIAADGYLDGIGMQGHLSDTTDLEAYIKALKMYSDAVSEVQITELDVTQTSSGKRAEYFQGKFYRDLFAALLKAKREGANLTAVTIWGLTDDNSWKKEASPLLFRGDLSPKLAYTGIISAKTGEPLAEPGYEAPDLSDGIFSFEEPDADAATLGFVRRGDGTVAIQSEVTHSGVGAIRNSGRTAAWNGTSFDVTRFAGQTIAIQAWVKSEDPQVKLTADIDGVWPNVAYAKTAGGEWTQLHTLYTVPADLPGLSLYFETNGSADIYLDDVSVKVVGIDEGFEGADHIVMPRGVGHVPNLTVTKAQSHQGRKSLLVTREAQEASVQLDVSKYAGRLIEASAFVKTTDKFVKMGIEDTNSFVKVNAEEGWTEVRGTFLVPEGSSVLYLETSGVADFFLDDVSVRIGSVHLDMEDGKLPFTTRWDGAGTLKVWEKSGNRFARLTNRTESYHGICYDISAYLGMEVEISFDVQTDDTEVRLSGDIDGIWPCYFTAPTMPGSYTTVTGTLLLPKDLTTLRIYIETNGTSNLFVDNFTITRPIAQ